MTMQEAINLTLAIGFIVGSISTFIIIMALEHLIDRVRIVEKE